MINLKLTLGNSFFEHFYLPYSEEFGIVLPKISQHKIVLSEKIINYYMDSATGSANKLACRTFIQDIITSNKRCCMEKNFDFDSMTDELMAVAGNQPMKILMAEKTEIQKAIKGINLLTVKDILEKQWCAFNLYTLPVTSRYIPPKEGVEGYKKWFKNWMQGETKVIIRDKYLLSTEGMTSFKNHFLPLFEEGMNIEIQTDSDVDTSILDQFDQAEYDKYSISVFKCQRMHDRVLIFGDFQIVIGKGVSFLSGDWNLTGESFISISNITINAEDTKISRLR